MVLKKVVQMELHSVVHWDYILVESLAYDWVVQLVEEMVGWTVY